MGCTENSHAVAKGALTWGNGLRSAVRATGIETAPPAWKAGLTAVRVEGRTKAEVARDYGVSRRWVHELVRRFDAEGEAGLEPRSRRPRGARTAREGSSKTRS
jgi:transposase